ncbi:DUF5819 family protein [Calidifontibacter indicus]|uniref:DUF5819 family protein n=1 Tax=Calidifontibacter indicus TaxID=419650 RepID=UPI003D755F02
MNEPSDRQPPAEPAAAIGGRARKLAAVLCAFVAFHLLMTFVYVVQQVPVPSTVRSAISSYMEPVFKQSWSVFAPDPVSYNTYFSVRAKKADGSTTEWFDVSRCDIDAAIKHHPVPNRRYLTTFQLMRHYHGWVQDLPDAAQQVAAKDATGDWTAVDKQLVAAGATEYVADSYIKSAKATVGLASQIARSRWGEVSAVQIEVKDVHTKPYADRNNPDVKEKVDVWHSGFNPVVPASAQSQASVDRLYAPKAGC